MALVFTWEIRGVNVKGQHSELLCMIRVNWWYVALCEWYILTTWSTNWFRSNSKKAKRCHLLIGSFPIADYQLCLQTLGFPCILALIPISISALLLNWERNYNVVLLGQSFEGIIVSFSDYRRKWMHQQWRRIESPSIQPVHSPSILPPGGTHSHLLSPSTIMHFYHLQLSLSLSIYFFFLQIQLQLEATWLWELAKPNDHNPKCLWSGLPKTTSL